MKHYFGRFILDTDARRLERANRAVHLTPKAYELFEILIRERPRAVAKHDLYDRLWPDTFVGDANLPVLIREIRAALGDDQRSIIRTVPRFGYAFGDEPTSGSIHLLVQGDREFFLAPGENVVGRDPKADITIASTTVSRRHALITIDGEKATVVDLKSKNGTWVAGHEVLEPTPLFDGAGVRVGRVELIYRSPSAQGETESARD